MAMQAVAPQPATIQRADETDRAAAIMEQVIAKGDLAQLTPAQRAHYYIETCRSVGLNYLTKPFDYIELNRKLTLYATRNATDQLRRIYNVSIRIVDEKTVEGVRIITAEASDPSGRTDTSIAAVPIGGLRGVDLANALMKCETKAKRRVTLSFVGLSFLDETEVETVPSARRVAYDVTTGERLDNGEAVARSGNPQVRRASAASNEPDVIEVDPVTGEILPGPAGTNQPTPSGEPAERRVNLGPLHGDVNRRFGAAVGGEIDTHRVAKRLGHFWFGVDSLTELTPKQLHDFRKKLRDLSDDDLMAEDGAARDLERQENGELTGMPATARVVEGEPGNDRFSR